MASEFAVELRDVVKRFITPEGNDMAVVDHVTMQISEWRVLLHAGFFGLR